MLFAGFVPAKNLKIANEKIRHSQSTLIIIKIEKKKFTILFFVLLNIIGLLEGDSLLLVTPFSNQFNIIYEKSTIKIFYFYYCYRKVEWWGFSFAIFEVFCGDKTGESPSSNLLPESPSNISKISPIKFCTCSMKIKLCYASKMNSFERKKKAFWRFLNKKNNFGRYFDTVSPNAWTKKWTVLHNIWEKLALCGQHS